MKKTDLAALEADVKRSFRFVTGAVLATLTAYFVWFFLVHNKSVSDESGRWGEFGDFFGGLLNPVVAYFAFYWLIRSVLLQKEELQETRDALEQAADAQRRSAAAAEASAKIAAYTALLNGAVFEVQSLREQSSSLVAQSSKHSNGAARLANGSWAQIDQVTKSLEDLDSRISYHSAQRIKIEEELRATLRQ